MSLSLKEDLKDVYIFRRAVKTLTGHELSPTEPIMYAITAAWIRKVGEIWGLEVGTGSTNAVRPSLLFPSEAPLLM